eukprot:IDg6289t1
MRRITRRQHYDTPPALRQAARTTNDNMSGINSGPSDPSGAVTVFQPISHPVLRSLDAVK